MTIREKWEHYTGSQVSYMTRDYLAKKYPLVQSEDNLLVRGCLLPTRELVDAILALKPDETLAGEGEILASRISRAEHPEKKESAKTIIFKGKYDLVDYPWKIFSLNGQEIEADYKILTHQRNSTPLSQTVQVINPENVFVEEGFSGEYFTLNASSGPIYLGRDSEIMEGSVIRGPFALGEHSVVKLGAKIYGPTTIGQHSRVGGEVNNSVILGYSNKGHDGFLGNSVLGEWCNLGADTNNSNLKNNYAEVKIWNYPENHFVKTGLQFCGLIMGDHSKCGINTMFNTGTVVGVSANIFGSGFPRNFIPSFSWGGGAGFMDYKPDKAFETMELVMERRGVNLTDIDREIYQYIFENTAKYRKY